MGEVAVAWPGVGPGSPGPWLAGPQSAVASQWWPRCESNEPDGGLSNRTLVYDDKHVNIACSYRRAGRVRVVEGKFR